MVGNCHLAISFVQVRFRDFGFDRSRLIPGQSQLCSDFETRNHYLLPAEFVVVLHGYTGVSPWVFISIHDTVFITLKNQQQQQQHLQNIYIMI